MSAKDAPWVKWYCEEFISGVSLANLEPAEIGIYAIILSLIGKKGTPIEDDRAWIARLCNATTRQCSRTIAKLEAIGMLQARGGMIGNRRMLETVRERDKKSDQAKNAAFARWHSDSQKELNLAPEKTRTGKKTPRKNTSKNSEKPPVNPKYADQLFDSTERQKPQNSAISEHADASSPHTVPHAIPSRACARSEAQSLREEERKKDSPPKGGSGNEFPPASKKIPDDAPLTVAEIVADWNALAAQVGLAKVVTITESRRKACNARIKQYPDIVSWKAAFTTIKTSPFLLGENDRNWKADFDFMLQNKSFTKLVEGTYGKA